MHPRLEKTDRLEKIARCRAVTAAAVRKGRLKPAEFCAMCGVKCWTAAHHEDYGKPLDVVWLCRNCHFNTMHPDRKAVLTARRQRDGVRRKKKTSARLRLATEVKKTWYFDTDSDPTQPTTA